MANLEQWLNATPERRRAFEQERLIMEVGEEIWGAMRVKGLSKGDMAKKLGCSKNHVAQILNGKRNMTLRQLSDICYHVGLHPSFLMRSENDE